VSYSALSSGMSCSIINYDVSIIVAVFEPSGFCSVVNVTVFLVLSDASLYTSFHGLLGDVVLQYCSHEFVFHNCRLVLLFLFDVLVLSIIPYSSLFNVRW